jgi:hypothetical protein
MNPTDQDAQLRQAAFDHVNCLTALRGGVLDSTDLAGWFDFGGHHIPLINPQRDAGYIIIDADEPFGQPVISDGLPLTKLHHAASLPI